MAKFPHIYQLILNNDIAAIRDEPLKAVNKRFRLGGETYSPLSFACKHRRAEAAHILINKGASISFTNNYGESPLHFLCFSGLDDTLLAKKMIFSTVFTKPDKNGHTPLYYAKESGSNDLFDFILSEYAKSCVAYSSQEVKYCFIHARENLHVIEKTCKLFDLNKPFFTDKNRAFFERYMPVEHAIERTNFYNGSRRIYGQESERPKDDSVDLKMFKTLIENGMDINIKFEGNKSVLYKIYENKPLVKFLCEKTVALNSHDDEGGTFLQFYINSCISPPKIAFNSKMVYAFDKDRDYSADLDVIEYLISKGAIVNKPYTDGWVCMILQALDLKNEYILDLL